MTFPTIQYFVCFNQSSGKAASDFSCIISHLTCWSTLHLWTAWRCQGPPGYTTLPQLLPQAQPQAFLLTGSGAQYGSICRNTGVIPKYTQHSALQHPRLGCESRGQGRVSIKTWIFIELVTGKQEDQARWWNPHQRQRLHNTLVPEALFSTCYTTKN